MITEADESENMSKKTKRESEVDDKTLEKDQEMLDIKPLS